MDTHEDLHHGSITSKKENDSGSKKNLQEKKSQKGITELLPYIGLAGALFLGVGVPTVAALAVSLVLFNNRKAVVKGVKKIYDFAKKAKENKKESKSELEERMQEMLKKEPLSPSKEKRGGKPISLSRDALREMKTRSSSVSAINVLPRNQEKSTTNAVIPSSVGTFEKFKTPSISLSKGALERINDNDKRKDVKRSNSLPSLTSNPSL